MQERNRDADSRADAAHFRAQAEPLDGPPETFGSDKMVGPQGGTGLSAAGRPPTPRNIVDPDEDPQPMPHHHQKADRNDTSDE